MFKKAVILFFLIGAGLVVLVVLTSGAFSGDNVPYSILPPGGLSPADVPQFVVFGFDDNGYSGIDGSGGSGGMKWALDLFNDRINPGSDAGRGTYDKEPCRASFYLVGSYGDSAALEDMDLVRQMWRRARMEGHEIGSHSYSHGDRLKFDVSEKDWADEIEKCNQILKTIFASDPDTSSGGWDNHPAPGGGDIHGFRTPFLAYTDATFKALKGKGFLYDCSIEDGWQKEQNASGFCWPYTLDNGSPGDKLIMHLPGVKRYQPIGSYPGLWELPLHPVMVPPDGECARYGIPPGLRNKINGQYTWFDESQNKVPGVDYNLFFHCKLTREEALAVLEYTFDQHYQGNRAPFCLGVHSDIYSSKYPLNHVPTDYRDRQWVLEEFIDYILNRPEVRIVPAGRVIDWCRNPRPIHATGKTGATETRRKNDSFRRSAPGA
ncbi:MAG: polysaccharide deacetylase family protein [Thermodesulfobacteriota bacterium]